jgi:hypothetical protein
MMSKFPKIAVIVGLIIVVVGIGIAVGWFGSSKTSTLANNDTPNSSDNQIANPGNPKRAISPRTQDIAKSKSPKHHSPGISSNSGTSPGTPAPAVTALANGTNSIPDWEDKVDAILTSDGEDTDKAKKMLEMFPKLAPDAQEEVAHHLSNLTPDEDYTPIANLLTNSALSESVLDVFMEDVLNRPNAVKLPLLLEVAQNPQHPGAQEAKDVLELFLEEDYGTDWTKWQAKMQDWLKENPD